MNKQFAYLNDTYQFSSRANITSVDEDSKGPYVVLDQTIFYPQGGGQPYDTGLIELDSRKIPVTEVRMYGDDARHYIKTAPSDIEGKEVNLHIDQERRLIHAKLHTAGHLISNIIEELYSNLQARKGHHFPGECYVEFEIKNSNSVNIDVGFLNKKIQQEIAEAKNIESITIPYTKLREYCPHINYNIPDISEIRLVKIGDYQYQPCGGTHPKSVSELAGLRVERFKAKKNMLKIYYGIS